MTGALVKAACRAVENGGGDAVVRELETLSEIPKLPEAIVSAVTPPTLKEAKEAVTSIICK